MRIQTLLVIYIQQFLEISLFLYVLNLNSANLDSNALILATQNKFNSLVSMIHSLLNLTQVNYMVYLAYCNCMG